MSATAAMPETGRWKSYELLLMARLKEMYREPEVVFWVFGFPILLALGLGIAFRNKPADVSRVALVEGPEADTVMQLLQRSAAGTVHVDVLPGSEALNQFRLGKYDLVVTPRGHGLEGIAAGVEYLFDPARPESVLARSVTNDALQAAVGRKDSVPTSGRVSSEPGARYIDFLIPGLLGMNLMNSGMWGIGFALVDLRQRKLLKRFVASPMRRSDFLLALASSRLVLMLLELALLLGFGVLAFHMRVAGAWTSILIISALGALCFGGVGLLTASRAKNRNGQRPDQPRHDAHVDSVGRLLLLRTIPCPLASRDQSAAAYRAERCPPRCDSGRCATLPPNRPPPRAGSMGSSLLLAGLALVPLDITRVPL